MHSATIKTTIKYNFRITIWYRLLLIMLIRTTTKPDSRHRLTNSVNAVCVSVALRTKKNDPRIKKKNVKNFSNKWQAWRTTGTATYCYEMFDAHLTSRSRKVCHRFVKIRFVRRTYRQSVSDLNCQPFWKIFSVQGYVSCTL